MLAALAPGSHTIHTRAQAPTDPMYEVTYNLTVADASSLGTSDGGASVDAP